jgi:AI-2 transport protein TqsA
MLLTIASAVIIIAGLQAAGAIILPILVAIFLAVICMPPVAWLQRKGVPDWAAVVVVFMAVLVVFIGLSFVVTSSIAQFQTQLPQYEDRLQSMFNEVVVWLESHGVDASTASVREQFDSKRLTGLLTKGLSAFTMVLSNTFLVMLTVVFVLSEAAGMPRKIRAMAGDPNADVSWSSDVLGDLRTYLAVKTQCSLMIAIPVTIMLKVVGVDYAILWGLLAFLLNYIPNLGSIIAAIPPILLTLLMLGLGWGIAVAAGYLAFNFIVGNMLEPRMMGRRLGLSTLVVFLSMVFWGWVWGPVGMVLSVPLTMIVKILLEHTHDLKWAAILLGPAPEDPELLNDKS